MRIKTICLFLALAFCLAALSGCSRESSIKENVSLRNNHSVIFAFNEPFKDAEAFADSIINLDHPDSVLVFDTLTITVGDTVYLMGFLRFNSDKIYRYVWHFEEPYSKDNKDTLKKDCEFYFGNTDKGCNYVTENSGNAKPHLRVYTEPGVYSPLFIAIDGNNARDTAGVGQYVRVIDTPPYLSVPKDTLWTRSKGDISFPIVAIDSFGTIKSLKVDLDASGKGKAESWKFQKLGGDSLQLTIKYDKEKIDSIGNQKIYIIVVDDDNNETLDSVNLHFNQTPKLKIISPEDGSTQNEQERLLLHFEATDTDNPASLRYFVRAANPIQSDTSIEEFVPNFTDRYLIAENLKEPYFVAITADGKNELGLSGRIYWDVWVTDGFDTVFADKVKDEDGSSRPRTFLLVDLKNPYGVFRGFVQYQGRSNHNGILIEIQDSVNKYMAVTDDKGYFSINVPSGIYRMIASDTSGNGYAPESLSYRHIELGQTITINRITLKDTVKPAMSLDNDEDIVHERSIKIEGKVQDFGSQVKEIRTWFDGEEKEVSFFGGYNKALNKWTWFMDLDSLEEGDHTFKAIALDSAGNRSDTLRYNFAVQATSMELTVNGQVKRMINQDSSFTFEVKIENANPPIDSIYFITNIAGADTFKVKVTENKASLKLKKNQLPDATSTGVFYEMVAVSPSGQRSEKVGFGFFGSEPVVYFEKPRDSITVSKNDPIDISLIAMANNTDETDPTYTLKWDCGGATTPCLADNELTGTLSWASSGTKIVRANITNQDGKTGKDSIVIFVAADPPTIKVRTDANERQKINSTVELKVTASDKLGTITKIDWGCSSGTGIFAFDENKAIDPPQRNVSTSVNITLPGTASENYRCIVKATDDDEESATDTISFKVILDKPYVGLNIKQQTLTINDETDFKFMAGDTLGTIVKYEKSCNHIKDYLDMEWQVFTGSTTVTMPSTPGTYYCAIQVTDDDGNTASDTASYNVLQASPWVTVMSVSDVTIKDIVNLDADAHDSTQYGSTFLNGAIVKYEWGCTPAGSPVEFSHVSTSTPEYSVEMPSTAYSDYLCIIQVTDDDGNTARDTAHINIMLDPPSVTVDRESATVREGFSIILDATASDGYGEIVKKEWSCGSPSEVEFKWREVSDLNTTWTAPAPTLNFMCIVRVTDDDGNTARDTMSIQFSTESPVITVTDEIIYVVPGMEFDLNATKNDDVWTDDNVSWYMWECYNAETKTLIKEESKYGYKENGRRFFKHQDGSYTEAGKDIYCVVTAEESSTGATFSDTTQVKIIVTPPVGVISAADTVFLWSGDESVSNDAVYFYTEEWGGMHSTMGPLGDSTNQSFRWKFTNVDDGYYEGRSDGTLDTSTLEFNEAFVRSSRESSMSICLDYRDSNTTTPSEAFYLRHRAEEVCRKVYFRKAWKNLATSDTVLEKSKMTTPPVLTTLNNKPVEAYLKTSTTVATKYLEGDSVWKDLSTAAISVTDSITSLQIANDGSNLYLAVLTSGKSLTVYKSNGGTSAWATLGSAISTNALSADISCTANQMPVVTFVDSNKKPNISRWSGSAWNNQSVPTVKAGTGTMKVREAKATYMSDGKLVVVYVDTTSHYRGYYVLYNSSLSVQKKDAAIDTAMSVIDMASDNNNLYIGFLNRSLDYYGPCIKHGTVSGSSIAFDNSHQFKYPIAEGLLAYHVSVAAKSGKLYAMIDDKNRVSLAQTHVYHLDGTQWKIHGENELPYFKVTFYNNNNYYLRGSLPDITISNDEKVYISMLAWENAGGNDKYFGPIVMKYVADNWTVH